MYWSEEIRRSRKLLTEPDVPSGRIPDWWMAQTVRRATSMRGDCQSDFGITGSRLEFRTLLLAKSNLILVDLLQ